MTEPSASESRWSQTDAARGDAYDKKWKDMAAAGIDTHGEVTFVQRYAPGSVVDAGCGTGRVGIELHRRGVSVVGFDLDEKMLGAARRNGPDIDWLHADAATVTLPALYDVVLMAGNVMIFVDPGTEAAVVANMASLLAPGGRFITGFSLIRGRYGVVDLDQHAAQAGLELEDRFSTWDADPWASTDNYAVSVFRRPGQ